MNSINLDKKNKIIISSIALGAVLIILVLFSVFTPKSGTAVYTAQAKLGDITKKVELLGTIKASQGVDMAFEGSGKITNNYVSVGDKIYAGQALVSIDSSILRSQLTQAEAQLSQAQANAQALDVGITESKLESALDSIYTSALGYAQKSVTVAKNSLLAMTEIQYNHFLAQTSDNANLKNAKAEAVFSLLGRADAGLWDSESLSELSGGAFGKVQETINNPSRENIDSSLSEVLSALIDVKNFIDKISIEASFSSSEKSSVVAEKNYISAEIITIQNSIQQIATQKVNNKAAILASDSQASAADAGIEAIKANVNLIKTQIYKTTLRALFDGKVDKNDAVVGSMVLAGNPIITISNNNLEIQTNIPESEMANIKIGDKAKITIDAFGNSDVFTASVVSIDSAPTIVNGISVYKARLKFDSQEDKIKSGMTANITVFTESKTGVLTIPRSAVIQQNGKYFVILDKGDNKRETREVQVGLKDQNNIEIISGLSLEEKVLAY